eukprot:scaffold3151_cov385-Prasinococcus_capsulatus_cf.AAC.6
MAMLLQCRSPHGAQSVVRVAICGRSSTAEGRSGTWGEHSFTHRSRFTMAEEAIGLANLLAVQERTQYSCWDGTHPSILIGGGRPRHTAGTAREQGIQYSPLV